MKKLFFVFFISFSGFSQTAKLDSIQVQAMYEYETKLGDLNDSLQFQNQKLLREIENYISEFNTEEQKLAGWLWLASDLGYNNFFNLANVGFDKAMVIAENENDSKLIIEVYYERAKTMYYSIPLADAIELCDKALQESPEPELVAMVKTLKGKIYTYNKLSNKAIEEYLVAIKYYEDNDIINKDYLKLTRYIGSVFKLILDDEKALEYYEKMNSLAVQLNEPSLEAESLFMRSMIIANLGDCDSTLESSLKALSKFTKLDSTQQLDYNDWIVSLYVRIANEYIHKEEYDKAKIYLDKSEIIEDKYYSAYKISRTRYYAKYYSGKGNYSRALEYIEKAKEINKTPRYNDSNELVQILNTEATIHYQNENYEEAYLTLEDCINANLDLVSEENRQFALELETKYETEKKQKEIALLNKDKQLDKLTIAASKQRTTALSIGLIFIILAAILAWNRYRVIKKQKNVIEIQKNEVEEQKKISEELLLNILPEETAKELKEKGQADAQLIDQVTVLFTDFKGFTTLSEQLTPKELVQDLHECFSAFDEICEKNGVEKIKTIGDSYMAAGGLPVTNSTHPFDVIRTALDMAKVVNDAKVIKQSQNLPFFEVRIGVHTGPVVAGIVGVKKFQYDIWGDTVNTASRMESNGGVGKVNISQATYELVKDESIFNFESRGKIDTKGKGEMKMWFVNKIT